MSNLPIKVLPGLAGRPPRNAAVYLARSRPRLAAQWVRSCRRAVRHLNDPSVPIDGTWIRLFNSLADRIGFSRVSEQRVDQTAVSASVNLDADAVIASFRDRVHAIEQRHGHSLLELLASGAPLAAVEEPRAGE